jgi:hypothetical protein
MAAILFGKAAEISLHVASELWKSTYDDELLTLLDSKTDLLHHRTNPSHADYDCYLQTLKIEDDTNLRRLGDGRGG